MGIRTIIRIILLLLNLFAGGELDLDFGDDGDSGGDFEGPSPEPVYASTPLTPSPLDQVIMPDPFPDVNELLFSSAPSFSGQLANMDFSSVTDGLFDASEPELSLSNLPAGLLTIELPQEMDNISGLNLATAAGLDLTTSEDCPPMLESTPLILTDFTNDVVPAGFTALNGAGEIGSLADLFEATETDAVVEPVDAGILATQLPSALGEESVFEPLAAVHTNSTLPIDSSRLEELFADRPEDMVDQALEAVADPSSTLPLEGDQLWDQPQLLADENLTVGNLPAGETDTDPQVASALAGLALSEAITGESSVTGSEAEVLVGRWFQRSLANAD